MWKCFYEKSISSASDTNLRQDTTQECDIEVLEEHDGNVFAFDREDLIEKYHVCQQYYIYMCVCVFMYMQLNVFCGILFYFI